MANGHGVVIVVAPGFAEEVKRASGQCHVWAVRTSEYEALISAPEEPPSATWNERGITLFEASGDAPERALIDVFSTVEEHHGEYSHDPPLDRVEVLGAAASSEVVGMLVDFGFTEVSATSHGFAARRLIDPLSP